MLHGINLNRIDLNLFVLFEAVREERHVGRAAARLNLSASAVSHGLARLRKLLNDPLFLRTPKGVVPTARTEELGDAVAEILARARQVVAGAEPFAPGTSTRRFSVGAPDGALAVILSPLLEELRRSAPRVGISVRQTLPPPGIPEPERAWLSALADLEAREIDVAIIPTERVPARFVVRSLFDEDFVICMRRGHPFAKKPSLDRYCEAGHLVVSMAGEALGFVDRELATLGRSRRIAVAVPNFMLGLAVVSETDLLAAFPRRLVAVNGNRFDLQSVEAPVPLPAFKICAVATRVALMDAGVAWLFETLLALHRAGASATKAGRRVK